MDLKEAQFGSLMLYWVAIAAGSFVGAMVFSVELLANVTSIFVIFLLLQSITLIRKGRAFYIQKERPGSVWLIYFYASIVLSISFSGFFREHLYSLSQFMKAQFVIFS